MTDLTDERLRMIFAGTADHEPPFRALPPPSSAEISSMARELLAHRTNGEAVDRRVLLLASYCGGDNPACSPEFPCPDCLEMCNVASAKIIAVDGGFGYLRGPVSIPQDGTSGVRVKALEWEDWTGRENDLRAVSMVGFYTIRPTTKEGHAVRLWVPGIAYNDAAYHVTVDDAKAAAQADFTARVLAALEPSP